MEIDAAREAGEIGDRKRPQAEDDLLERLIAARVTGTRGRHGRIDGSNDETEGPDGRLSAPRPDDRGEADGRRPDRLSRRSRSAASSGTARPGSYPSTSASSSASRTRPTCWPPTSSSSTSGAACSATSATAAISAAKPRRAERMEGSYVPARSSGGLPGRPDRTRTSPTSSSGCSTRASSSPATSRSTCSTSSC